MGKDNELGKWIAIDDKNDEIIASAETLEELDYKLDQLGKKEEAIITRASLEGMSYFYGLQP